MAILSHADYNFRWTSPAPVGFNQTICPPCYHEYIQREVYKQDYLDLFINIKTFERNLIDARYYVKVTGCPILGVLGIPSHDLYTIMLDGALYLLLDYDYPWTGTWTDKESKKKLCIKYVMIGEASPQPTPKIVGYGVEDKNNSFYYNILHIKGTGYFAEPLKAFGIIRQIKNKVHKKAALIDLADKSNILLDIFPFAIDYEPIRDYLNNTGVTEFYFKELMTVINLFKTKYKCKEDVKGVFVAPPTISHYLAKLFNGLTTPITVREGINTFSPPHLIKTSNNFFFNKICCDII